MIFHKNIISATIILSLAVPWGYAQEYLSWDDCVREAAQNNPDLIAAGEEVVQGKAAQRIASSGTLPQVSADLSAANSRTNSSGESNSFGYGASASQLLFDGLKTVNSIHAASESVKAIRENFRFTSATVRYRLREAFVNLWQKQAVLTLTQEILQLRQNNLELIKLRYESGTEHLGAYLTAQANVSQAAFEISQATRDLETAQRQLSKEVGRRTISPVFVKENLNVPSSGTTTPDYEKLAGQHPSLLNIMARKNVAVYDIKASRGDFFPEISMDGGYSKTAGRWPPDNDALSAGARVSLPLFDGQQRLARLNQDKSIYRQLEQQQRSTYDGLVLSLQKTWNSLQDAVENVEVQNNFLYAAEERAKISRQQYSVGLISFDNWTIIEDDLVRNKKSLLSARANALLAEANWILAKGETIEYEN